MCFPGKLNQVFVNIISNAIQAIEKEGTINIKTFTQDNNIKISIKDTGKGIEKSKLKTIFEPFYTTKPIGEGSGLGLAISKNIIDEHKGEIEVFQNLKRELSS
jgi:two-component system NtrC family sensor kinase